ncbi:DUF2484 family protein [Rhodovulum adriaticum]|uniref:Uncharacterized protein DUF2484 n=1 Tax=Rhodovulum adriaticum TaxID=35804 RepID=A0A4R2NXB5_RHOAD|nr:DUF2484 family protein [Rhodovulum adriaticum]MBK1636297.1 hypothetical protein [Rhodovulum adriaticum]TCP26298.1 uncharacterized protein DUF2484 [Rhodovulum adriaticum]
MSAALTAACLWALAASAVAFLPMRLQYLPGGLLLLAAPGVVGWLAVTHGAVVAALAVLSLFRRPLAGLLRRVLGKEETR